MRWVLVLALAEGVFLKPDKDRMLTGPKSSMGLHGKTPDEVVDIDQQIEVLENQKSEAFLSRKSLKNSGSCQSKQVFWAKTAVEERFFMKL